MDFNFDENVLWILGILALIFFLFPQKNKADVHDNDKKENEEEEEEKNDYIYRRNPKERKRLVY